MLACWRAVGRRRAAGGSPEGRLKARPYASPPLLIEGRRICILFFTSTEIPATRLHGSTQPNNRPEEAELALIPRRRRRVISELSFAIAIAACVTNLAVVTDSRVRLVHEAHGPDSDRWICLTHGRGCNRKRSRARERERERVRVIPFAVSAAACLLALPLLRNLANQPVERRTRTSSVTFAVCSFLTALAVCELLLCIETALCASVHSPYRCNYVTLPCTGNGMWERVCGTRVTAWTLALQSLATITTAATASVTISHCRRMQVQVQTKCCDWSMVAAEALHVQSHAQMPMCTCARFTCAHRLF